MTSRQTIELVGLLLILGAVVAVGARVYETLNDRIRRLAK